LNFLDPNHVRANNNKIYYETVIKNQTLAKKQKGDSGISDSESLKMISTIDKDKKYQIINQRPDDYLEEREIYEELCRQNGTQVKFFR
jgi:hypothetical protein